MATTEKEVKKNTAVLSTGVEVEFRPISTNAAQDLILTSFSGVNLNSMNNDDIMKHGDKIVRYNTTLVQDSVFLTKPLNEVVKELGLSNRWLPELLRSGRVLDKEYFDMDVERDREILFIRYHAIQSDDDIRILNEKVLGELNK